MRIAPSAFAGSSPTKEAVFLLKWLARTLHVLLVPLIASAGMFKLGSGTETIREVYTEPLESLGYSVWFIYIVGFYELIAALGLLVGFWRPGIRDASLGLVAVILAGAAGSNLFAGLYTEAVSPFIGLVLATAAYGANRHVRKSYRDAAAPKPPKRLSP